MSADVAAIVANDAVLRAVRILRLVSAHEQEDADDEGQSRTATEAAADLEKSWAAVKSLWKAMAFPRGVEDAGRMADEMDRLLAVRSSLQQGEGRDGPRA